MLANNIRFRVMAMVYVSASVCTYAYTLFVKQGGTSTNTKTVTHTQTFTYKGLPYSFYIVSTCKMGLNPKSSGCRASFLTTWQCLRFYYNKKRKEKLEIFPVLNPVYFCIRITSYFVISRIFHIK